MELKAVMIFFVSVIWTMVGIEVIQMNDNKMHKKSIEVIEHKTDMMIRNDCIIDSLIKIDSINVL